MHELVLLETVARKAVGKRPIIAPDREPAFRGDGPLDFGCPSCGEVLIEGAVQRQFYDLVVRCFGCGRHGGLPSAVSGEPFPGTAVCFGTRGKYRLSSAVEMTKPVAVISNRTKERYEREVGIGVDGVRLVLGGNHVNPRAMRRAARYLRRLLGGAYPKLAASYERGIASPTPPPDPHRIVSLERSLREAADSLEETGELALTIEVSEAIALAGLFRRWENHPAVAPMQTSLVGTDAVYHALATLVTASYLADAGNGVSLRDDVGSHSRVADLWGRPTVTEDFEVEVKSPRALRVDIAESHATDDAAIDIAIRRAFKAAASSRRGQLSQGATGVLALGCFYLSGDALQHVHQVAGEVLHGGTGKPHVAAIAIAAFAMPRSSVTPAMTVNLVPHTRYEGGLTIR